MSILEKTEWCWEDLKITTADLDGTFRVFRDAAKNPIRMTTTAYDAQLAADELDAYLPTPKLLDARYAAAKTQIPPQPKGYPGGEGMDSHMAAIEHDERVSAAVGTPKAGIVSNVGKHWVLSNRAHEERAVLYGWHLPATEGTEWKGIKLHPSASDPNLRVIQPESNVHNLRHRDYSMTLVLVHGECYVNGKLMDVGEVMQHPDLCALLCHDGRPLQWSRQPGVPEEGVVDEPPSIIDPHSQPPTIRLGDSGTWVATWQHILITDGLTLEPYGADGDFGKLTEGCTKSWQREEGLRADGIVGPRTWQAANEEREAHSTVRARIFAPVDFPKHPDFAPIRPADRNRRFGKLEYVSVPVPGNPEAIRITNHWDEKYIAFVDIPQLVGIPGAPKNGRVAFHKKYADQLKALFQAWEDADLMKYVLSWAGSWAPRFIRGSRRTLSNHAYASAVDMNATWNPLGSAPKPDGEKGSVFRLVPLANKHGFYWGGHYSTRPDGMHFEVAKGIK